MFQVTIVPAFLTQYFSFAKKIIKSCLVCANKFVVDYRAA